MVIIVKREELVRFAEEIPQPSEATLEEYTDKMEVLVSGINERLIARPDLSQLIGSNNVQMMRDNHQNHARFMQSVFALYQPEVLVYTVLWVYRAYRAHGFQLTYGPAQLNAWLEVYKEELSEKAYNEIAPFYNWMLNHQALFVQLSDEMVISDMEPVHTDTGTE